MIGRHSYTYAGNMVSTKGIEAYLYDCARCGYRRRTKDPLPPDEVSRTYKVPGCFSGIWRVTRT